MSEACGTIQNPKGWPIISPQLIPMSAKTSWATGQVSFTMNRAMNYPSGKAILGKINSPFKKKKKKKQNK